MCRHVRGEPPAGREQHAVRQVQAGLLRVVGQLHLVRQRRQQRGQSVALSTTVLNFLPTRSFPLAGADRLLPDFVALRAPLPPRRAKRPRRHQNRECARVLVTAS